MIALRVLSIVVGVALVVWVLDAAIRNFMLPRGSRVTLTVWIATAVGWVCDRVAPRSGSWSRRDKVLAMRPAMTLLGFQCIWLFLVFAGFAFLLWGVGADDADGAIRDSGSALFTLGFATPGGPAPLALVFAEAVIGLTLLALLVSYLPTIYAAFQRREFMVAKLAVRAGSPSSPWGALEIAHRTDSLQRLDQMLWSEWENWFIEVGESHTSLPILTLYRSPDPDNHWVSAARTMLDLAALRIALVDSPAPVAAHVTIRSGTIAVRTIADYFRFPYDPDPSPGDPISISREQFDAAADYLEDSGVPIVADRDQAWTDFAGWRVNYDHIVEAAAVRFSAPPNPWDEVVAARTPFPKGTFERTVDEVRADGGIVDDLPDGSR